MTPDTMIPMAAARVIAVLAAAAFAAWAAVALGAAARDGMDRACARLGGGRLARAVAALLVVAFVHYGATKGIMSSVGHDESIHLVDARYETGAAATNLLPASVTAALGHGTNIVAWSFSATNLTVTAAALRSKIWWRETNRDAWTNLLASVPAGLQSAVGETTSGPTTTVYVAFGPTNACRHASFYVGDDLPPVYVDVDGAITFDALEVDASKAVVTYTVDAATIARGAGEVVVERALGGGEWSAVLTVAAEAGTHTATVPGFMVDRRSIWRLRLFVEEDGQ